MEKEQNLPLHSHYPSMKKNKKLSLKELIIYEDDNYIIINKPPHIATLDDRHDPISVKSLAKEYHADAQVNHRLDKETSGLLVIAKHPEAYRHFSILLEDRQVAKTYHAISWGRHNFGEVLIEAPLEIKNNGKVIVSDRGKYSATIVKTLKIYNQNTLIECKPITGKKHQIRIHLASGEAPIINDEMYGGKDIFLSDLKKKYKPKADQEEVSLIDRFALHSKHLVFESIDGKTIEVEADYPKDFSRVIKQLDKWG